MYNDVKSFMRIQPHFPNLRAALADLKLLRNQIKMKPYLAILLRNHSLRPEHLAEAVAVGQLVQNLLQIRP